MLPEDGYLVAGMELRRITAAFAQDTVMVLWRRISLCLDETVPPLLSHCQSEQVQPDLLPPGMMQCAVFCWAQSGRWRRT